MKQTKHFRRLMSVLLVAAMLLSMVVVGLVSSSAAESSPALTYSFKYDNAGYAEGRVRLTASSTSDYGQYILYWADDTKALEGYAPITTITLNQESRSFALGEFTAIPADATKLIAAKAGTKTVADAAAVYDIPESKQFKYSDSEKDYNFQTLSDIHIHKTNYYEYAEAHFASALNAAAQRGAAFVSTCGDNTNYGDAKEWGIYLSVIANSDFTGHVYEINGNHEPYDQGEIPSTTHTNTLNMYKYATGLNVATGKLQSEPYYEITAPNGDHHIYMALELVNNKYHPGISDNFTKAQIDWLEGLLNKYKNDGKKIFIYEHAPFAGYGAGDNKVAPHYGAAMTIDAELYPQTYRFKELLEANKDIIWFSGHTHIDFKYNYNIDNENGTTAYTVHVPSSASTTTVNASGGLDYVNKADSAQGYFVDVYKDAVVLNGTDLVKNEILPLYTYLVDYSGEELIENEVEPGEEVNYKKVVVTVDASIFEPKSVKVLLYGADDETLTQYVTMIKDTDGLFKANVSTQFTKMKFAVATDAFTINSAEYAVADSTTVLGAYKVAYDNPNNWAKVNVYAWNSAGGDLAAWPGVAMTKEADGTYTAVIPDFPNMIIFNNGTGQTDDLEIAPYIKETIKGSYTVNATPTPPVEDAPEEPVVPVDTVTIYFEKPDSWTGAYIYGFYGEVGQTAEAIWPADYPGKSMTLVSGNTYKYDVPVDIDYIKFSDGDSKGTNNRTDNIPGSNIGEDVVFGITTKGSKYWNWTTLLKTDVASVGAAPADFIIRGSMNGWDESGVLTADGDGASVTYTLAAGDHELKVYEPATDKWYGNGGTFTDTCEGWTMRDTEGSNLKFTATGGTYKFTVKVIDSKVKLYVAKVTDVPVTTPATTAPATTPSTTVSVGEVETISIYFTNNENWENVYLYGFYGVEGQAAEREWPSKYPGEKMTLVRENSLGQAIYSMEIPADIDYIKFSDGTSANERTNNIPNAKFTDGAGFYLTEKVSGKWNYDTYTYTEEKPADPTTSAPVTTIATSLATTAPVTDAPTTAAPITAALSTAAPTTAAPVTAAPTTAAPTTAAPVTAAPTTAAPVTAAPTTAAPSTTAAPVTAAPTTVAPASSAPAVEPIVLLYGNVDMNEIVNVKDATAIQKHIADLITLSEQAIMVADVDASGNVNVKDATCVQKKVADIITVFPSGEYLVIDSPVPPASSTATSSNAPSTAPSVAPSTAPSTAPTTNPVDPPTPPVPDAELTKLLESVKKTLSDENYYASYTAYADLKKVYFEYKDANVAEADVATAIAEINTALTAYNTMKQNNPSHVSGYQPPKAGTYLLRGTMNNWDESGVMSPDGSGVSITYTLAAGEHMLKVYDVDTAKWYGNGGTFTDTCTGWTMTDTAGDLKFTTTGGTYKFYVAINSGKVQLTVTKQ